MHEKEEDGLMTRKKFIAALGRSAAGMLCINGFLGCIPTENPVQPPSSVDFTLDLDDPGNQELRKKGGYIFHSGIIIAHTAGDGYVAVSEACTHHGNSIDYRLSEDCFVCLAHGSEFETDGTVRTGPARIPLVRYNTLVRGRSLTIFS